MEENSARFYPGHKLGSVPTLSLSMCVGTGIQKQKCCYRAHIDILFKLKNEVELFMAKRKYDLTNWFDHEDWL